MAKIVLDHLQKQASSKYGDTEIEFGDGQVLVLRSILRLPKETRMKITSYLNLDEGVVNHLIAEDDNADQFDAVRALFAEVADDEKVYAEFCEAVGDDPAVWLVLLEQYLEEAVGGKA